MRPTQLSHTSSVTRTLVVPSGFSLIEAMAITSIISVTLALAIPQFRSQIAMLALRSETSALQIFLERNAAYALTSQSNVEITATGDILAASRHDGTSLATHRIRRGVQLDPLASSASSIQIYPFISASPATLVLTKNGRSCSVIISLRCRVRSEC
jgi:type II secretory pathway pseudopilin PulG